MKAAEWKRAVKPLLPADESWVIRGRLCYRQPVVWTLHGVLAESSSYSRGARIWSVLIPLFLPDEVEDLSYSNRVGHNHIYELDDRESFDEAVRTAMRQSDVDGLAAVAAIDPGPNTRLAEARGYALILLERPEEADRVLAEAMTHPVELWWHQEIADRLRQVRDDLHAGGSEAAVRRLSGWRDYTCQALKIVQN